MYTILDCLEHNTNQFPQNIICEDPHERVSFQEFTDRAKTVGYHLSQRYRPERRPIVVFMDNTAQSWTAMIGAVYSGNFYAVADAQMPMERIRNIVAKISPLNVFGRLYAVGVGARRPFSGRGPEGVSGDSPPLSEKHESGYPSVPRPL